MLVTKKINNFENNYGDFTHEHLARKSLAVAEMCSWINHWVSAAESH